MTKPIHTYLDLDVVNNNMNSSTNAPQLRFEENRNTPFLEGDSSEYFCSIVRFSIQTGNSLPIFIPRVVTGQGDINKTVYGVTLSATVTHNDDKAKTDTTPAVPATTNSFTGSTSSLSYSSPDSVADVPQQPLTQQDLSGTYYYQYNIKDIVKMSNAGLAAASKAFTDNIPAGFLQGTDEKDISTIMKNTYAPYFEYDYDKCRLVLNLDQSFNSGSYGNGTYAGSDYFNTRFYELLSGLPCIRQNRTGDLNYQFTQTPPTRFQSKTVLGYPTRYTRRCRRSPA